MYNFHYSFFLNNTNPFQYPFFQSNILCMFLSFADLMFALTCGVPTAIHLTFAEFFSSQNPLVMVTYARLVKLIYSYTILLWRLATVAFTFTSCSDLDHKPWQSREVGILTYVTHITIHRIINPVGE